MLTDAERKQHQLEATQRWRMRNPEKVQQNNRRPRQRIYNPTKAKQWRETRLADPAYRARVNTQANARDAAMRRWLDQYKMDVGCIDCGFKEHPAALHFDHVTGNKALNVCNAKSLGQAQREIEKCVVRCANCHAINTFTNHLASPCSTAS